MQSNCDNDPASTWPDALRLAWLDRLGIGVSLTCTIHCVGSALLAAAPAFAAGAAPSLGERFEWAEGALLWTALAVGAVALIPAYLRDHRRPLPVGLFAAGIALVALARTLKPGQAELAGTTLGVALVTSAHIINLRLRKTLRRQGSSHDH